MPELLLIAVIFFCISLHARAQSYTISGNVQDLENGETLIGATVYDLKNQVGTVTNLYGFYSLTIPGDSITLSISYVGYKPTRFSFLLGRDTVVAVGLKSIGLLEEVIVKGDRTEAIQERSSMSSLTIPVNQVKAIPTLMGEADLIKVLQLLPGIQSGNEGSSGLYVRGGGPEQNLILLDGAPMYNPSHLYGFFSTFNADAINHIELVKGGFPARYGGRLSSVVDISMREGNQNAFAGQGSVGVISSKLLIEGPISKRTSFIVSARRSYLNLLKASAISKQTQGISDDYYFYDFNAKVNHRINERNRIYLSGYLGKDKASSGTSESFLNTSLSYSSENNSQLHWGNAIVALRWNHIFSKKIFSNFTTTYSQYQFGVASQINRTTEYLGTSIKESQFYNYKYQSGINDFAGRLDFDFIPNPNHYIRFGFHSIKHKFTPGVLAISSNEEISLGSFSSNNISADEFSTYFEDDWQLSPSLKLNIGMHAAAFRVEGKTYASLQPRISVRQLITDNLAIKASYAKMNQFVHLLTNAGIGLPTDLWVPTTATIQPQSSNQWALGIAQTTKGGYEVSIESYYKKMDRVIEYKDGASYLNVNQNWQDKVEIGRGESYGAELFLHKKQGKINGWIGYTLSWTNRQFDNLNNGEWFPYRYDRRHDAKLALTYAANNFLDFGLTWVYGSGNAITIPYENYAGALGFEGPLEGQTGGQRLPGSPVSYIGDRNSFRMRDYHRLDLSAGYSIIGTKVSHRFSLSIYNAYGRRNPFYLEFGYADNKKALKQVSLFSILPSLSYSIKI